MASHYLSQVESGIHHMSESVFAGVCRKVGTPTKVLIRREVEDIKEILSDQITTNLRVQMMVSGSHREGFRMEGSDVDIMYWFKDTEIVWDLDEAQNYNTNRKALILCDCSESPPGFTLLEVMIPTTLPVELMQTCVRMNDNLYISSSKWKRFMCSALPPNYIEHGPCGSGYHGNIEFDYAISFQSNFWPPSASSWRDRCHSWPQPHIVHDIVRNGCHFVAIGHKLGNHEDNEWRVSFSKAEQKLVYSMNHCQFLIYGLLKIFLKEVINSGLDAKDKSLCSYHMKTAVFWAIQQNTIPHWCPQNLLECFWICFKLLLKWMYEGACPNFFIPENNMFLSNIHGEAQNILFCRLHELYKKGLACLLHSSSIRPYVINVLCDPRQTICTDEYSLITEAELDLVLINEVYNFDVASADLHYCMKYIHIVEHSIDSPLTQYQVASLQKHTAYFLQTTAFVLFNRFTNTANKLMYTADKMICHMLRLAAKFGCISDMLYIAMYHYRTSRYRKALSIIETTKLKLAQPYVLYNYQVDPERYSEAVGGQSLSTKLRQATADNIKLHIEVSYMIELIPEQSGVKNGSAFLFIPPFVLLYMLELLCSLHTYNTIQAQRALHDLQVLVYFDQGMYVHQYLRHISWQILGICQQITGDVHSALFSYQQSLRQILNHEIRAATLMRIQEIMRTI